MSIVLNEPRADGPRTAVAALREWQREGAPMQLHPGDVGWFLRFGQDATIAAIRTWSSRGRVLAVGLLDGPTLLRMTVAPDAMGDEELALRVVDDIVTPGRGVLPEGDVSVELPLGAVLHDRFDERGWGTDEPWTPLRRDLSTEVERSNLRIEAVGMEHVAARVALQRAAFDGSTFTAEKWRSMAAGPAYVDARCLVGFDTDDRPVATVTVWSAGPGRPGLLEPMGVHPDHRGRGYGRAISLAAAATLQELGSSSALVCTPTSNVAGVATYAAAGFERQPEVRDRIRVPEQ